MRIDGPSDGIDGIGIPGVSLVKRAARGVGRGVKKGGKFAAKGGKFAVKMHLKAFLAINKLALKGFCKLPGPLRAAAVGAALTAGTGGAGGAAAPVVSEAAASAICKAMRSGKRADLDDAQTALEADGVAFQPSIWQEIMTAIGLG